MLTVLYYIGLLLGALIGSYMVYMVIVSVVPGFSVPEQPLRRGKRRLREADGPAASRRDVTFKVEGTRVRGWLYLPEERSSTVPCVVMGHGLGGTMATGLDGYARRFRKAGLAVLAFDYRHLGESGGEPRQLVWIPHQLQDWAAAVEYARGLDEVDASKIALWGTSLSGGHVVVTAARDNEVAAISAQCPLLEGNAGGIEILKRFGLGYVLKMTFGHALRDMVRSWLRLSPHTVPLVGAHGTVAIMADGEAWKFFEAVAPDDFVNRACARILIRMDKYHPIHHLPKVRCPVLLQVCEKDISLPPTIVDKAEKCLDRQGEVIRYPIDHFDIYQGEHFETAVSAQIDFFGKHL